MGRDFGSSGFEDHRGASTLPWGGCRVNRFAFPRAFPGVVHSRQWMCTQRRGCWIRRVRGIYDLDLASVSVDQIQAQVARWTTWPLRVPPPPTCGPLTSPLPPPTRRRDPDTGGLLLLAQGEPADPSPPEPHDAEVQVRRHQPDLVAHHAGDQRGLRVVDE